MLMHGFLFINKRLLISCDTGIYAIMKSKGDVNGKLLLFLKRPYNPYLKEKHIENKMNHVIFLPMPIQMPLFSLRK